MAEHHFYGKATEEHYEKKLKDFTVLDWTLLIIEVLLIFFAIAFGLCLNIGVAVILIGLALSMIYVMVRVIFKAKNNVALFFSILGIATVIAGIITCTGKYGFVLVYGICIFVLICFGAGVLCLVLGSKTKKKIKEYSLTVEADCVLMDIYGGRPFEDVSFNPLSRDALVKPSFHYVVNGQEYYTESKVYYGDMNQGFKDGSKVTLQVNPQNPTDILPKDEDASMETIMGISWIVGGFVTIAVMIILAVNGCFDRFFIY